MFTSTTQFKRIRKDGHTNMRRLAVNICFMIALLKLGSLGSCQMDVAFKYFENTTCCDARFG